MVSWARAIPLSTYLKIAYSLQAVGVGPIEIWKSPVFNQVSGGGKPAATVSLDQEKSVLANLAWDPTLLYTTGFSFKLLSLKKYQLPWAVEFDLEYNIQQALVLSCLVLNQWVETEHAFEGFFYGGKQKVFYRPLSWGCDFGIICLSPPLFFPWVDLEHFPCEFWILKFRSVKSTKMSSFKICIRSLCWLLKL